MKKKGLAVVVILLFIGMSVIPSATSEITNDKNVIIVDDEGDGDYTSIRDALNNSVSGDIIQVYSGTYNEHSIYFNVSDVTLEGIPEEYGSGNDVGKPTIFDDIGDRTDIIKLLRVSDIIIDGFILKSNDSFGVAIRLIETNNSVISNNTIIGTFGTGVYNSEGNYITISNNIISGCDDAIEIVSESSFSNIIKNDVTNNYRGIYIKGGLNNAVKQNNFINNSRWHAFCSASSYIFPDYTHRWIGNYWGKPRIFPKVIVYQANLILYYFHFDWNPAQEPYDIEV